MGRWLWLLHTQSTSLCPIALAHHKDNLCARLHTLSTYLSCSSSNFGTVETLLARLLIRSTLPQSARHMNYGLI